MTAPGSRSVKDGEPTVSSVRKDAIVRGRVTGLLAAADGRPLTVVCAAAGWGKTTAVAHWASSVEFSCAWVSLDADDNDPRRLCAKLLAAVERVRPTAMADSEQALIDGSDLVAAAVSSIAMALAERAGGGGRFAIVLDDYHLIIDAVCHRFIAALIDSLPPGARVVLASRVRPPLGLGRRRVAETVAEIGPRELAFKRTELEALLHDLFGLRLHPEQLEAIEERVEGWPAGSVLIGAALRACTTAGGFAVALGRAQDAIADYLVEEVLDQITPELRMFLRRTSVLRRFSGPLCAAVLGEAQTTELLAEAQRANLAIATPDGGWARYSAAFVAVLARDLRTREPELVPELHRRASTWCATNGLPEEAIAHASAAGDGVRAAGLLSEHWIALVDRRRYRSIRRLIAEMPADRGSLAGLCDAIDALCMVADGMDPRFVAQRLDELEEIRDEPNVAVVIDYARVSPYYGDVSRAVADGWRVWNHNASTSRRANLAGCFAAVLWFAGDLDGVHGVVEPFLRAIDRPTTRALALAALALSVAAEGDADLAERYARQAVALVEMNGLAENLNAYLAYVALGKALRLHGALELAGEQLERAARVTSGLPGSIHQALTLVFEAQLALTARDRLRAERTAAEARRIIDRYRDVGVLADRLVAVEEELRRTVGTVLPGSPLTAAELRVLTLQATGLSNAQIAEQLYVSSATVRSHIRRLNRRLGVHTREEAIAIAQERGLLSV